MYYKESENSFSNIGQYDGNVTISDICQPQPKLNINPISQGVNKGKSDKIATAIDLPVVAAYNSRSLFPKLENFKIDLIERKIYCAFVSEVWEQSESKEHLFQIEKMLQIDGLKYISTSRPSNKRGGGVALVVNLEQYSCEKINIFTPKDLEVVWGLLKPKSKSAQSKKIIACSLYSPPNNGRNTRLADYLVGALQMLSTKYPDAGIIMGADKNKMDITPILNCGLRLKQTVNKFTRQDKIIDILIMNLSKFYNSPIVAPPLNPDDPSKAKPSDHSVPVAIPHTDRCNPPGHCHCPVFRSSVRG